ncbi:MAG: isoprenylcysteine carboxylmethyltransferase family protein [Bacteroidota bacterium]
MKLISKDVQFVGLQVLLFAAYIFEVRFFDFSLPDWLRYFGLLMSILGILIGLGAVLQLNKNLSPFPTPKTGSKLIVNGFYAFSRHPIYHAILLCALGYSVFSSSIYKGIITIFLFILFTKKSAYEEKLLENRFKEYKAYKKKTRRFL